MKVYTFAPFKLLGELDKLAAIWVHGPHDGVVPPSWLRIWNGARSRYCADGGANEIMRLIKRKKTAATKHPDLIVGDFDSISHGAKEFFAETARQIHILDQDSTDLGKALQLLRKDKELMESICGVVTLDSLSERFDHIFGALNAMLSHQIASGFRVPIFAIRGSDIVTLLPEGKSVIYMDTELITGVCGLIPLCQLPTQVTTSGLEWNLDSQLLEFGGVVSTSNRIVGSQVDVHSTAPLLLTFELKHSLTRHAHVM